MKKWILNLIEIIIFCIIGLGCIVSILQSTILKNKSIYGYRTYVIASNSMYPVFEVGDVILVKEVDYGSIVVDDIITYRGEKGEFKNKIITHEVIEIMDNDGVRTLKTKGRANTGIDPEVFRDQVYGKFVYRFLLVSFISKIVRDELGFVLFIFIPFGILFVLEFINMVKESKRRELEKQVREQLNELKKLDNKSKKGMEIEETICVQLDQIENAKRDFKKMDTLLENISVDDIQREIDHLKNENKIDGMMLDKTMVLFKSDDIKKEIRNELKLKKKIEDGDNKKKSKVNNKKKLFK